MFQQLKDLNLSKGGDRELNNGAKNTKSSVTTKQARNTTKSSKLCIYKNIKYPFFLVVHEDLLEGNDFFKILSVACLEHLAAKQFLPSTQSRTIKMADWTVYKPEGSLANFNHPFVFVDIMAERVVQEVFTHYNYAITSV